MIRISALVLMLLLALSVLAEDHNRKNPSQQQTVKNENEQSQRNQQSSVNHNDSTANNGGQQNSQTTEFRQVRSTPTAYAPDAYPTAPCRVGGSMGLAFPGVAGSIGGSKADKDCQVMELGRLFAAYGNKHAAAKAWCHTQAAKRAKLTMKDCQGFDEEPVPAVEVKPEPIAAPPQVVFVSMPPLMLTPIVAPAAPVAPPVKKKAVRKAYSCHRVVVNN